MRKNLLHAALILPVIGIEIAYRLDAAHGFFLYCLALIIGGICLLRWNDEFLGFLLLIPLLRIIGTGIALEPLLKYTLTAVLLLLSTFIMLLYSKRYSLREVFGLKRFDELAKERKLTIIALVALIIGLIAGSLVHHYISFPESIGFFFTLIIIAIAEETYFRGVLLKEDQSPLLIILVALLYTSLAYSTILLAGIFLVINIGFGWLYRGYRSVFPPMLIHAVMNIILIMPKIF